MELFVSIDPAFASDSAGYCAGAFNRNLNGISVTEIGELHPPLTPDAIFALAETLTSRVQDKHKAFGCPVRVVLDTSSNFSLAVELARRVPVANIAFIRFHGGGEHTPHPTPSLLGMIGGKNTAALIWSVSRRELINSLEIAANQKRIVLPVDDPEQTDGLNTLRKQLSELSVHTTDAGRTVIESSGHDDVAIALSMGLFVCERWPWLNPRRMAPSPQIPSAAWT
jgi:hypothetical protein